LRGLLMSDFHHRSASAKSHNSSQPGQSPFLDHAFDAVFVWEWDGPITRWNSGATRLYGFAAEEAIGRTSQELLHTAPAESVQRKLDALATHGSWEGELIHTCRDGTAVLVDSRLVLVRDADPWYVIEITREITARKRAEERLAFLAEASAALAASLDPTETLTNVANLVVPRLADWCAVHLVAIDGRVDELAVAHTDPAKVAWARELQERYPSDPDAPHGVPEVLRTGQSVLYAEIPASVVEASALSPEHLTLIRELDMRSAMIVPLMARDAVLGAITLVGTGDRPPFDHSDLSFAEEVAQRCALAVDNARLFAQARSAEAALRHANADLEVRIADRTAELMAANRDLARWGHIFEHAKLGIVVVRPESERLELMNPAYAAMHGYTVAELRGRPVADVFAPEVRGVVIAEFAVAHEVGHHIFESIHLRRDGTTFPVQIDVTAVKDEHGQVLYRVANVQDISERKAQEAAVLAANKELEAFSYSVSHDLRAPLRVIDGFSRILVEDYAPLLPDEATRYLQIVRDGTTQMGALIDDLLSLSRLGRQAVRVRSVAPAKVVADVLHDLEAERAGRPVDVCIGDLPECQADPALLKQVYANLISNALKYSRGREPARIEIGAASDPGGSPNPAYFVRDNGVGFDMAYAHKLFGVFQRLHRAEDYEGTGVGLAIVQRIIHKHGGRVWAEAAVDRGATFWFTLPVGGNQPRCATESAASSPEGGEL
jgi:PAS domain S-box-containing protein